MYGCPDPIEFINAVRRGEMSCTHCSGVIGSWGFGVKRVVRHLHGESTYRPHRIRCKGCKHTDVVLPWSQVYRHRDDVTVLGTAVLSAAKGNGYWTVAKELDRPVSTVRNWIRHFKAKAGKLCVIGTTWHASLDVDCFLTPQATPLADAVEAMGAAAKSMILKLHMFGRCPWQIMNALTRCLIFANPPGNDLIAYRHSM